MPGQAEASQFLSALLPYLILFPGVFLASKTICKYQGVFRLSFMHLEVSAWLPLQAKLVNNSFKAGAGGPPGTSHWKL